MCLTGPVLQIKDIQKEFSSKVDKILGQFARGSTVANEHMRCYYVIDCWVNVNDRHRETQMHTCEKG